MKHLSHVNAHKSAEMTIDETAIQMLQEYLFTYNEEKMSITINDAVCMAVTSNSFAMKGLSKAYPKYHYNHGESEARWCKHQGI